MPDEGFYDCTCLKFKILIYRKSFVGEKIEGYKCLGFPLYEKIGPSLGEF